MFRTGRRNLDAMIRCYLVFGSASLAAASTHSPRHLTEPVVPRCCGWPFPKPVSPQWGNLSWLCEPVAWAPWTGTPELLRLPGGPSQGLHRKAEPFDPSTCFSSEAALEPHADSGRRTLALCYIHCLAHREMAKRAASCSSWLCHLLTGHAWASCLPSLTLVSLL